MPSWLQGRKTCPPIASLWPATVSIELTPGWSAIRLVPISTRRSRPDCMRSTFPIPIPGGSSTRTSDRRMNGCLFSNPSAGSASIFNPAASLSGVEAFDVVLANAVPSYNGDDIMHASGDVILRSLALGETHLRARWPGLLAMVVAATVAITTQTASVVARGSVQPGAAGLIATGNPATPSEGALNDAARSWPPQSSVRFPPLAGPGRPP